MKTTLQSGNPNDVSMMHTTFQSENLNDILASLPPERRAEVEKLAVELSNNEDVRRAADILENSQSLEDAKFVDTKSVGELGWLMALAFAIGIIAI